jgi:hypothetical protein
LPTLIDQETISLPVTQFLEFFRQFQSSHTHFQAFCELLKTHNSSGLQLTYSWLNLSPPCIHTNLDLPAGINVKVELSLELSYSFVEFLSMSGFSALASVETANGGLSIE